MFSTADFKKGLRLLIDGEPCLLTDYTVQTPTARGSATLVKAKVRNILTGAVLDRTFKAGEKFEEPDLQMRPIQFLYRDASEFHFMDTESYEQFQLSEDQVGDAARWLTEGAGLMSLIFNGRVAGIQMPPFMEFDIVETEPAVRGDTASGRIMKECRIGTGAVVKVPLYMESGERILVSIETGDFVRRVSSR